MNITDEKEKYFNTLFNTRVIRYGQSVNGLFVETKINCNNVALESLFRKLHKDYKVNGAWNDFYNECIYWTWVATMRFEIKDGQSWNGLIEGTDKPNTGRLITNIKTTVKNEINRFVNDGALFTRGEVNGVKGQHVTLKFDMRSLDTLLASEGGETEIIEMVREDQSHFHTIDLAEYQISYFAKWFRENKERILEPSQIVFLKQLEKVQKVDGYTINDTEASLGMTNSSVNSRMRRIKNRIANVYLKENVNGAQNRLQMTIADEMELWAGVVDILEGEDLLNQNESLSDWILQNVEIEKVANILYDNLNEQESIQLTKAIKKATGGRLPSPILYTFVTEVEKRINELKNMNTTITPVTKAPNYKQKEWEAKKKEWDRAPIVVYDLEGNFLRLESVVPKKRKANIQLVLASGIHLPI